MKVWKVVRKEPMPEGFVVDRTSNPVLFSAVRNGYYGTVRYRVGVPTYPYPLWGPLVAFRTRAAARQFVKEMNRYTRSGRPDRVLFKAEATLSPETSIWYIYSDGHGRATMPAERLPADTVFCESITLLEQSR